MMKKHFSDITDRQIHCTGNIVPTDFSCFTLLHHPIIGFYLVSAKPITKGTLLCGYGGKPVYNPQSDYQLYLKGQWYDASEAGEIGSLFAHLPDPSFAKQCGFTETASQYLQFANVHFCIENKSNRVGFVASEDIMPGTVLGFNYGLGFWLPRPTLTPLFFKKQAPDVCDLASDFYEGVIVFRSTTTHNPLHILSHQSLSALLKAFEITESLTLCSERDRWQFSLTKQALNDFLNTTPQTLIRYMDVSIYIKNEYLR